MHANVSVEQLGALKGGESLIVRELMFGTGITDFWTTTGNAEEIFTTDLEISLTEGQLGRIGVFKSTRKQQYSISFSEGGAFE
jgi:hypothetical protein